MAIVDGFVSLGSVPAGGNPYLEGNYAPVGIERMTTAPLLVDGSIPPVLSGLLLRNGPNPAVVRDPHHYHPFAGDGMVHAVELFEGRAVSYRNRFVRTRRLAAEIGTPAPRGPAEPFRPPANTHVIEHAGRFLALSETGFPVRLTPELDTVCIEDFDAMLASSMTAHPKLDPDSGALVFFGYDVLGPPFLRYHELDADGELAFSTEIEIPRPVMIHDFGVSANHVVFFDSPVVYDKELASESLAVPFLWRPQAGARVGILPRRRQGDEIVWIDVDPGYVFHVMNTYDMPGAIVIDVCRAERGYDTGPGELTSSATPALQRWRIDLAALSVDVRVLDDTYVDLLRVDDVLAGRPYRYGYGVEVERSHDADTPVGLLRYDLQRDEVARMDLGEGQRPGEAVFVRAPDGRADDEGWLLCVVYDATRDTSDLWILDAQAANSRPEAIVHLPACVPFGSHGSWVPETRYR